MSVSLSKGGNVSLATDPTMTKVLMGLGWDPHTDGQDFDLDASAFLLTVPARCAAITTLSSTTTCPMPLSRWFMLVTTVPVPVMVMTSL